MNCPSCKSAIWNPFFNCENCNYSIPFTLQNPSEYQAAEKWPKHGLIYDGTGTVVNPSAWGQSPGSKFISTVDITKTFQVVAASGETIIPRDSGRPESYIFYVGTTIGGGLINGQWRYFYAVRLVKPNEPDKIHIFPDDIRSFVDKEVICARCGRAYVISKLPEYCLCGKQLPKVL